ncbi:hypothetical protein DYB25_001901, partial [Aphanomyces astaci]
FGRVGMFKSTSTIARGVGRLSNMVLTKGRGSFVWNMEGQKLLDFTSGIAVTSLGHCHPRIVEAVQKQAAELVHGQVRCIDINIELNTLCIANGYPLSAIASRNELTDLQDAFEEENTLINASVRGAQLVAGLTKLQDLFPILDVRGVGLMVAVEFDKSVPPGTVSRICQACVEYGMLLLPTSECRWCTSLHVSRRISIGILCLMLLLWPLSRILSSPRNAKPPKAVDGDDALTARLALERTALQMSTSRLNWELKFDTVNPPANSFWRRRRSDSSSSHPPFGHSLACIKLHVEVALHERAITVLSTVPATVPWRHHLRRDVLYRTLANQAKWLAAILAHAKSELGSSAAFRRRSADEYVTSPPQLLRAWSFHDDMVPTFCSHRETVSRWHTVLQLSPQQVLPPTDQMPSSHYLSFELFLLETCFDKSDIGQRLRHIAATAYASPQPPSMPPLHPLVDQIANHLIHEHGLVPSCRRLTLNALVRQMVHIRLASAYYRIYAPTLASAARRYDLLKPRMHQLAVQDLAEVHVQQELALPQTRAALEAMPTFIPDTIMGSYMSAIGTLHAEVGAALQVPPSSLSADVILPSLVLLFGQANLPHLALQVHVMEMHLMTHGEGEVAYYVALAQAALGAT